MITAQEAKDIVFTTMNGWKITKSNGVVVTATLNGIEGYCATYVWRMAKAIITGEFNNSGSGAHFPREGFVSPSNDSGCLYSKALNNLGFVTIAHGQKSRDDLISFCENSANFKPGMIVNYWHIEKLSAHAYEWGHTQMYMGGGKWESSYNDNYKSSFVYSSQGESGDMWFYQVLELNGVPAYSSNLCGISQHTDTSSEKISKLSADVIKRGVDCANWLMTNLNLTKEQAAGIVGNLILESGGINPTAENKVSKCYGIAQWCPAEKSGKRKQKLEKYANDNGLDANTIYTQLQFLKYEMENKPSYLGLNDIRNATSYADAANIFCDKFERPGAGEALKDKRRGNAHQILDALNS